MEPDDERNPELGATKLYGLVPRDIEQLRIGPQGSNLYSVQVFESFQYPRLPARDYIRLLHLHPCGHEPSLLRGYLRVHKLDAQCEYEAISYSWGDYPKFTQSILLNGQVLKITENLHAALMAYGYPDRPRVLWADAICINQADTAEKGQQIAIMADIYSKAKVVQVWLAPPLSWGTGAIQFMTNISLRAESFGVSDKISQFPWRELGSFDASPDEAKNLIHDAIQAHVDVLYSRSWFNRVWVVQEATLATELVVSCGLSSIGWNDFAIATNILRGAVGKLSDRTERQRMGVIRPAWGLVWHRNFFRLLDQPCNRSHHIMTTLVGSLMRNRNCSDDRDRVYAMLAMTTSPYDIIPDYTNTVAETYTRFARRYSPNTQIHAAGLCRRQRQPHSEHAGIVAENGPQPLVDISDRNYLPSWVPEFRPSLNLAWVSPSTGVYSTAIAAPYIFLSDSEILSVMHAGGTIFDVISVTTCKYVGKRNAAHLAFEPVFYFSLINQLQHILTSSLDPDGAFKPSSEPTWLILAKALTSGVSECEKAELMLSQYPHFQSLSGLEVGSLPWLTAIWDQFKAHCLSPTGEVFQQILLEAPGGESKTLSTDGKVALGFLHYVADILETNQLFTTMDGYLGLAPRDISDGDFIAVFNGLHVPYVVRPAGKVKYKDSAKREERTQKGKDVDLFMTRAIQVIGPCYLHGIMKGEIFTNRDAPQFSRLKWTRYDGDMVDSLKGRLALI